MLLQREADWFQGIPTISVCSCFFWDYAKQGLHRDRLLHLCSTLMNYFFMFLCQKELFWESRILSAQFTLTEVEFVLKYDFPLQNKSFGFSVCAEFMWCPVLAVGQRVGPCGISLFAFSLLLIPSFCHRIAIVSKSFHVWCFFHVSSWPCPLESPRITNQHRLTARQSTGVSVSEVTTEVRGEAAMAGAQSGTRATNGMGIRNQRSCVGQD